MEIEVYPDSVAPGTGYLQGSWFTFSNQSSGGQGGMGPFPNEAWLTFGGNATAGGSSAIMTIYSNAGGRFNAPPVTSAVPVGFATLAFSDCMNGEFTYLFTGSGTIGSVPLTRLTQNVSCGNAVASGDFGLSGNWYDASTSGQGLVVEINPNSKALFLAWYTYPASSTQGVQRWYTGLASYSHGARSVPFTLRETSGGGFNQPLPEPTTATVGTGTLTFTSCSAATLVFSFTAGSNTGQAGSIALSRVGPTPASCSF